MPRTRRIEEGEGDDILAEARRIVEAGDAAALAPTATLAGLSEALADGFDLSYTAERVADMLAPARWRSLKARLSRLRPAEGPDRPGHVTVHLPPDVAARLRDIDEDPLPAIRALLAGGGSAPERGSGDYCLRRRCAPRIPLADPAGWACGTCGLSGRTDLPPNEVVRDRLADQQARIRDLHALATEIYESWRADGRFTPADCTAQRLLGGRADRGRLAQLLPELVAAGLLEEAPGPRGGAGYRVLDEPPEWVADAIAERRRHQAAEARLRGERAAALGRVLEEGLTYTRSDGVAVAIDQSGRGLELRFPGVPGWEVRDLMKRQGHCRWDARRRRWCRSSPVTGVEPWLASALEEGAVVEPYGSADPDFEDWGHAPWPD